MVMTMAKCILMLLMSMFPVQMLPLSLFISILVLLFDDVDCASGVDAGVDVSVDVNAAPHVDVDAVNDDVAQNANSFGRPEQIIPSQKRPGTCNLTRQSTQNPTAVYEPWTK